MQAEYQLRGFQLNTTLCRTGSGAAPCRFRKSFIGQWGYAPCVYSPSSPLPKLHLGPSFPNMKSAAVLRVTHGNNKTGRASVLVRVLPHGALPSSVTSHLRPELLGALSAAYGVCLEYLSLPLDLGEVSLPPGHLSQPCDKSAPICPQPPVDSLPLALLTAITFPLLSCPPSLSSLET